MREVNGNDLLNGSDHEFVVNLYTVLLNRWPDEDGYRHHLQRVENRPDMRRQLVEEVAGSPEGRNLGITVVWPGNTTVIGPTPSVHWQVQVALMTGVPLTVICGTPGDQGATTMGVHGTVKPTALAETAAGLEGELQMPNGRMLANGTMS